MRLIPDHILGIITVYQEAEGEPFQGKIAVAEVILNRTREKYMSDGTVTGTVLRRLQFSGHNSGSPNRIRSFQIDSNDNTVMDCIRAWSEAQAGSDYAKGALHYYNERISNPKWAEGATTLAVIGNHRFVRVNE